MASGQDSGSATLMDLITSDPGPLATNLSSLPALGKGSSGDRKNSKKPGSLMVPVESLSPGRVLSPVKAGLGTLTKKKKPLSYSQLARSLHELAAAADQKSSQNQLVNQVFPKLAVYNSVDPSLAPSLLMLHQQCEDRHVLRYVYYYLARILSDSGSDGMTAGGGISTPNWDALADLNATGVTRADVVPRIIEQLAKEAANDNIEVHARRVAALKSLTFSPTTNSDVLSKLYEIVFAILDKVADAGKLRRKKGMFGRQSLDKEHAVRSNLQYSALSTLRRLPLDPGNPAFLHRAVQGIACADPVGVRHALAIVSELAARDPYAVAMAVAKLALTGGILQEVLQLHDVLARVYLARLCYALSHSRVLDERPDLKSQYQTILYQLLLDPSERVCFEAIMCILGKFGNNERLEERAGGWALLTTAILKFPDTPPIPPRQASSQGKDGNGLPPKAPKERPAPRPRRPQPLIKLVMRRLDTALRSPSRPVLHAAARVVQEIGRSRAAAFAFGGYGVDENSYPESLVDNSNSVGVGLDSTGSEVELPDGSLPEGSRTKVAPFPVSAASSGNESIASMLSSLMEAVRTTVACECVYVRGASIKALIWMQSPHESFEELRSLIAGELSDPVWPASLLNEILLTLHARFKATPQMAVILLEIARLFATKVPGKIDSDVLQLLWKTCLLGAGPGGKHTALEAVTVVLDLPPPQPASISVSDSIERVSASDPKSALALQRLVQAAVWFLGENANYAASEYAWESAMPPGTALMMLDIDKMVAAASSRNPTLAGALTRLQRCSIIGSWEVRIVAAQALMTIAIRSGEPYRLQIYELLQALAHGGSDTKAVNGLVSNGEDQGASGTGLSSILAILLNVLNEMYKAQDELIKDMRNHDNSKQEWTDDELRKLYESHERLLDLVSLFCYVPREKYLPLGPTSAGLINIYRNRHRIDASLGFNDPAVATGISDLMNAANGQIQYPPVQIETSETAVADLSGGLWTGNAPAVDLVNEFLIGAGTDAPEVEDESTTARASVTYDEMWAKQLLETSDNEEVDRESSGASSPESVASYGTSASSHFGSTLYPSLFGSSTPQYGKSSWQESRSESEMTNRLSALSMNSTMSSTQNQLPEHLVASSMLGTRNFMQHDTFGTPTTESMSGMLYEEEELEHETPRFGKALYDFTAGGDEELNLTADEELEIEYEVDGWYHVRKKRPGRDGKITGLVPILYVTS